MKPLIIQRNIIRYKDHECKSIQDCPTNTKRQKHLGTCLNERIELLDMILMQALKDFLELNGILGAFFLFHDRNKAGHSTWFPAIGTKGVNCLLWLSWETRDRDNGDNHKEDDYFRSYGHLDTLNSGSLQGSTNLSQWRCRDHNWALRRRMNE